MLMPLRHFHYCQLRQDVADICAGQVIAAMLILLFDDAISSPLLSLIYAMLIFSIFAFVMTYVEFSLLAAFLSIDAYFVLLPPFAACCLRMPARFAAFLRLRFSSFFFMLFCHAAARYFSLMPPFIFSLHAAAVLTVSALAAMLMLLCCCHCCCAAFRC